MKKAFMHLDAIASNSDIIRNHSPRFSEAMDALNMGEYEGVEIDYAIGYATSEVIARAGVSENRELGAIISEALTAIFALGYEAGRQNILGK